MGWKWPKISNWGLTTPSEFVILSFLGLVVDRVEVVAQDHHRFSGDDDDGNNDDDNDNYFQLIQM